MKYSSYIKWVQMAGFSIPYLLIFTVLRWAVQDTLQHRSPFVDRSIWNRRFRKHLSAFKLTRYARPPSVGKSDRREIFTLAVQTPIPMTGKPLRILTARVRRSSRGASSRKV